ncbi:MAG: hypothetical protein INR72_19840 [Williamsia herbipolensis]|nr:hypothetical protein [Williamsia herbipolensis]
MQERQDHRWTLVAAIASAVGLGALVTPSRALRALGSPPAMDGRGDLGWRLFGARNLAVAAGLLRGDRSAQVTAVALQVPDQVAFVVAYRSGDLERRTFVLAMVLSTVIVGLGGSALASPPQR